jgi:hypothetical protein
MNPARMPVLLVRNYGRGAIVFAQLGAPSVPPKRDMDAERIQESPAFVRALATNLIRWAEGQP